MMASNYKPIGTDKNIDDKDLTTAGSIGSFFNGSSRLVWGLLYDKFTFK